MLFGIVSFGFRTYLRLICLLDQEIGKDCLVEILRLLMAIAAMVMVQVTHLLLFQINWNLASVIDCELHFPHFIDLQPYLALIL